METVCLIAYVYGRGETIEELTEQLIILAEHTRKEAGNIGFVMHRAKNDPSMFVFYETYKNEKCFDRHLNAEHSRKFADNARAKGLFSKEVEVIRLDKLSE